MGREVGRVLQDISTRVSTGTDALHLAHSITFFHRCLMDKWPDMAVAVRARGQCQFNSTAPPPCLQ